MSTIDSDRAFADFDSTSKVRRKSNKTRKLGSGSGASPRKRIARLVSGGSEVVVKITGFGRGAAGIRRQLAYVSRDAKLDLENDRGDLLSGAQDIKDYIEQWQATSSAEKDYKNRRDTVHMVLAMPHSSDEDSFRDASRAFAKRAFGGNHEYVFAMHTPSNDEDTEFAHMHVVVKLRGFDGKRMNPRKADLQEWRETFAEELRRLGLDVQATPRVARGQVVRGESREINQGRERLGRDGKVLVADAVHLQRSAAQVIAEARDGVAPQEDSAVVRARARITGLSAGLLALASVVEKEKPNERPDYDRLDRKRYERVWRTAVHQSGTGNLGPEETAKAIASLRNVPPWHVVPERSAEMLLRADAPGGLGRGSAAGDGLRRSGVGADRAAVAAERARRTVGVREPGEVDELGGPALAERIRAFVAQIPSREQSAAQLQRDALRRKFARERHVDVQPQTARQPNQAPDATLSGPAKPAEPER